MRWFLLIMMMSAVALGQSTSMDADLVILDPVAVPPSWLEGLLVLLKSLPVVGPLLAEAVKWSGVIASCMTSLSLFLMGIKKAFESVTQLAVVGAWAQKGAEAIAKVLPYVKYLSMFNVQKPVEKK